MDDMSDDTTNWTNLREFAGVDITQSYALSWMLEGESLLIDLDLFLKEEHPFFEKPRPAQKACFRPAFLEFPLCTTIQRPESNPGATLASAAKTIAAGKITGLTRTGEGEYEICGDFGTVTIEADRPLLRIKDLAF
jgi:hypothetical protein